MGKERREEHVIKHADFQGFLDEFQTESDRAAAVLGAAYLSESLRQMITTTLVDDDKLLDGLLEHRRPLGDLWSRTQAAYSMGLISEDEYDDLNNIGEIRNRFAHDLQGLRFSDKWAKDKCSSLNRPRELSKLAPLTPDARNLFNVTIAILHTQMLNRIKEQEGRERPSKPKRFRMVVAENGAGGRLEQ